ncbi:MAG: amino acid ABC transporter permease, partial [Rhodococcus sp. (in: high G+C Gram-positive bacteria)]
MSAPTDVRPEKSVSESQLPDSELVVARTWHPLRWVISAVVLVLLAQFIHGLVVNPGWDWPTFAQYFTAKSVLAALWMT